MSSLSGPVSAMALSGGPADGLRPTMRRKSSAQNLLSSFKTNPNTASQPSGPLSSAGGSISVPNGMPPFAAGAIPAYPQGPASASVREFDAQSMYSDTTTLVNGGGSALPAGTSVEYLRDLVQKRIITLTYLRNVHEGRSHWFHTIIMTRGDLDRVFNNTDMKKRTKQFAILGMSLSSLLDVHQPQDLLRGLLNTLNEYDQSKEESDKPKKRLFKTRLAKRQGVGGFVDYTYSEGPEASYLVAPHMPFPLDYHQTLLSLLDVLSEVYAKISRILGPSPFPHSSQHMMGPLGLLAPHPGVSYIFSGNEATGKEDMRDESSLWGIAHGSATQTTVGGSMASYANAGPGLAAGGMSSPPPSWTPALADMVLKVDAKFKKITSVLLKELDAFARNGIKDELASLDPLLRNVPGADDGREQYDFEGYP